MDLDEQRVGLCVRAIRRYLEGHPDAADSLRGVVDWWVPSQGEHMSPAEVIEALRRLIAAGEVEERRLPGVRQAAAGDVGDDQPADDTVIFSRRR